MTRKEAFSTFGVTLRNERNAWSGRNYELGRVVVTAWTDYFNHFAPELLYSFQPRRPLAKKAGRTWLVDDLKYAIEHCDGIVHVVLCEAKDTNTTPREIRQCAAQLHMVMKIVEFDPTTANWMARVIYRPVEPQSPRLAA
jgi:hypothetical protein